MKVTVDGTIVAEAEEEELIRIEGNWYFPPSSVVRDLLTDSPTPYTCPWKGVCQYHDVNTPLGMHLDAAWSYPKLMSSALDRVGKDFSGYIAFDRAKVTIS